MIAIHISKEIEASLEQEWNIVSDVDREPEYWQGTKSINNLKKYGNIIEREVIIAFKNSTCREIVTLDPKKSVKIEIIDEPIKGTKNIILNPIANNDKTRVDVQWDIKAKGFFGLFKGMIKKHISKGTEDALERISKAAV
jgi:uncharacterized protein YaaR (DUF327 family)